MFKNIISFGIYLIIFSLPLYLLKVELWWVPFTLLELMIYGVFIVWFFSKIKKHKVSGFRFQVSGYKYPILLIFIGLTISTLFSADIQISAGIWKGWFLAPLLFFIVFINKIKTAEQIKTTLISLTLSGFLLALIGLWYWFLGDLTYDGRLKAFYLSPNHLAMYLAPILILSFGLWGFIKNKWQRIVLFIIYFSILIAIYLTYSYGAWLGLIGAGVFMLIVKYLSTRRLIVFILLLIFLIFFQLQTPKAQNLFNFSRSSLESRLMIWRAAMEIIKDHSLIGIGPGVFQKYYLEYQPKFEPYLEWASPQPHNIFLAFWLQTGLIGLIGFIWLLIQFFKISFRQLLVTRYSLLITGSMIYILIHGLVDTTYWKNDLSIIFWLIIALSCIVSRLSYSQKTNNLLEEREVAD